MNDPRDRIAELEAEIARLREREAALADTLENAAVAMQWVGGDGVILWANQALLDMLGRRHDEYVGHALAEFSADPRVVEDITRLLGSRQVVSDYEAQLLHKSGAIRHVLITSNSRWDGDRFLHSRCVIRDITDRKRNEERLRRTNALLSSLLHHSPLPVVVLTAEGLVTRWNAAAERVFGWTAVEVAGKPLPFIPSDKLAEHREMRARDLRGDGFVEREIRRVRKDGRPIDLLVSTDQLRDKTGAVTAIISVYLDITDRKRAHDEVRQAGERLLFALDAASMMAWEWTLEDDRVTRAGKLCEELGLAHDGPGDGYLDLVHPEDRQRIVEAFDAAVKHGADLDVEFRIALPDGSTRWISDRGRMVGDAPAGRMSGVMLDITARKAAQDALRESERRLQETLDNSLAVVYLKDIEGHYLLVNRRFEKIFNVRREEALGKTDFEIFPREHAEAYRSNDLEVIAQGAAREFEESATEDDGEHTYISVKFPMRNARGEIYGVGGISTDITERKRLEANLRESAKLESLGVLAGGVAHDFNNLLVGIVGNASLLLSQSSADARSSEMLEAIIQAGERAAQLTRQMLAYAGRAQFAIAPLDLSDQVRQIAQLLDAALPKHVDLRLNLASRLPPVAADAGQLQQVVMNLILNAAESIDPPGGKVDVSVAIEDWSETALRPVLGADLPAGRYLVLRVSDTGSGMDAATKARIFDPFFTTKFTGRGLGLAATLGILRAHRAGVQVESAPGAGSTFTVLFPPSAFGAPTVVAGADLPSPSAGARVLVVDDEHTVRQVARRALERHGYRVEVATDGRSAINWLDAHDGDVDLVLLDLAMPVCGGDVALEHIRKRYPRIAVVCSSGYAEGEASGRFGPGAAAFLQKPYTIPQLLEAIQRALVL